MICWNIRTIRLESSKDIQFGTVDPGGVSESVDAWDLVPFELA
jgi:hypothetical protein